MTVKATTENGSDGLPDPATGMFASVVDPILQNYSSSIKSFGYGTYSSHM